MWHISWWNLTRKERKRTRERQRFFNTHEHSAWISWMSWISGSIRHNQLIKSQPKYSITHKQASHTHTRKHRQTRINVQYINSLMTGDAYMPHGNGWTPGHGIYCSRSIQVRSYYINQCGSANGTFILNPTLSDTHFLNIDSYIGFKFDFRRQLICICNCFTETVWTKCSYKTLTWLGH